MADAVPASCAQCAAERPDDAAALAWACTRNGAGSTRATSWLCPDCARHHVRDIEARLDPEWWEQPRRKL
jgi:predicted RNA-binding Zn-ribbon protein involved in translation (DUF1610 family)